jgi:hypothetical protein
MIDVLPMSLQLRLNSSNIVGSFGLSYLLFY